jgi:hypothetical protein
LTKGDKRDTILNREPLFIQTETKKGGQFMKINMSHSPETIPGKILELVKNMNLERGAIVQFMRTDGKRKIWTMKLSRSGKNLHFNDWNKSTELKVLEGNINEIVNKLRGISVVENHGKKEDHISHYRILADAEKKEAVA